ncbi:KAR9-domain-containing protein [Xylaria bambusicola]|uniref:KAR9-domain-containing protein n=1 Tax=Xylaria bambusicola TaxID=326684 RepID=UPI002007646D|nr:KAR9-domain-containing protein [Xylaria bambusicola]KAI0516809.1 KAR9-domain-containing protein [Xylaria bambusicola]
MTGLSTTTLALLPHPPSHSSSSPSPLAHHDQDSSRQAPLAQKIQPGLLAPTSAPAPDRQHVARAPPEPILTFSDLSSDLLQLDSFGGSLRQNGSTAIDGTACSETNDKATPPTAKSTALQRRKPSPGLAARLKALGFGSGPKDSSDPSLTPSPQEPVGRLPEDQLRTLDLNHQLNSTGFVVERRGRPWKGAGAPLQLLRSRSSRDSLRKQADENKFATSPQQENHSLSSQPQLLPEISKSAPLEMDTNKYILPDHTNGNGTKATLETRRDHLERDVRVPKLDDQDPPPPPPLPKDTPPEGTAPAEFSHNLPSYFNPLGLQRPGSIYTISRASFHNQLAQLTSLSLPDARHLSSRVAAIPTAQAAAKALIGAAEQIRQWIAKASEVIEGLDSEDDVEWAAAGGREGYEEVENAITRFEELINVYVTAIEDMQGRSDIASVSNDDLQKAVTQMELIMGDWTKIRKTLNNAKGQVETAMEWEELWNMVLGDIQNEMDDLSRLVFEMEERRHKSIMAVSGGDGVDIGDLETIVEETPPAVVRNNRFSVPAFPLSPSSPGTPVLTQDDSSLLALFARMQPLRASLDFLPMRLSVFEARASQTFPTACDELEMRKEGLEASYRKLEKDADSLRKELGEDKWVLVFRGAGRQAQKLVESVDRSMTKLRESIDQGLQFSNPPVMGKKIENYEAKKTHYGPAIERVLSIIDKGVKDRLTVNGEILRFHAEIQSRWEELKGQMKDLDGVLEEIQADRRNQQLRDSISSMLSNDRSTVGSGNETPGSSPPSSVVMSSLGLEPVTPIPKNKSRSGSTNSSIPQPSSSRRSSSTLAPHSRRTPGSRLSVLSNSSNLSPPVRSGSATPLGSRLQKSTSSVADNRPRWNSSTNTRDSDVGHNFKPLTLTTPSPYTKRSPTPVRSISALSPGSRESRLPLRSPLSRGASASPAPDSTPSKSNVYSPLSFRERVAAASPSQNSPQILPAPKQRLTSKASASVLDNRRASFHPPRALGGPADIKRRAASSLSTTARRTSLLPVPKSSTSNDVTGRVSATGSRKSNGGTDDGKPRWRY